MSLQLVAFLVLQFSSLVFAADPANCTAGWTWASNSLGQNPCVIAGLLEAPCRNLSSYVLGPLGAGSTYIPPPQGGALACECNTVMYSLFMACTACQNVSNITTWNAWDANCPAIYISQYPGVIPSGTAVPYWAYLNVTVSGSWTVADSQAVVNSPESTATPIPTVNVGTSSTFQSPTGTGGSGNTVVSTPTPTPTTSGSSSSSNAGAIAGGVVGGLAALGILAGFITWFVLRKRRSAPAGQAGPNYDYTQAAPYSPPLPNEPQMKLYNPNDPSSFPTSAPDPPSVNTNHSGTMYPSTLYDPVQRGRYTGAPEL